MVLPGACRALLIALFGCDLVGSCLAMADLELRSLHPSAVPIEGGGIIEVEVVGAVPKEAQNATCRTKWRIDSWHLPDLVWTAVLLPTGRFRCGPMPALPAEGPVDFFVMVGDSSSTRLRLHTFATLSASLGRTPYYGSEQGELLVRINDTAIGAGGQHYLLSAVLADGSATLLAATEVSGGDVKRAVPLDFREVEASADTLVNVSLVSISEVHSGSGTRHFARQVRLMRVAATQPGAVAVDHSTRGLLVDGKPFFPISWMTTALQWGTDFQVSSMVRLAEQGANSIMVYNLASGAALDQVNYILDMMVPLVMDTAMSIGMKVHLHIIDITMTLAKTGGTAAEWQRLDNVVMKWRNHPALLAWYVADDGSGPYLNHVYNHIKQLDPYHVISMAIAGVGDAWEEPYFWGADMMMAENYGPFPELAFDVMHVLSQFPYDWSPMINCGRAWDDAVLLTEPMFRSELYNTLIAGSTGVIWFAHRNLPGQWSEPGPLLDASGPLGREMLDLVPAMLSSEVVRPGESEPAQPLLASVSARRQNGSIAEEGWAVRAVARREASGCVQLLMVNNLNEPAQISVRFTIGTAGIFTDRITRVEAVVPFEKSLPARARLVPVVNGEVNEWLPSWGSQVFRFNGTGDCARLPVSRTESGNLVANPSFEESFHYVASPDLWPCSVAAAARDRSCFADSHSAVDGRRSGRFVTGRDSGSFRVGVPLSKSYADGLVAGKRFLGEAWVRVDRAGQNVSVLATHASEFRFAGNPSEQLGEVVLASVAPDSGVWVLLRWETVPERGLGGGLAFAVSRAGVLWLDAVEVHEVTAEPCGQARTTSLV